MIEPNYTIVGSDGSLHNDSSYRIPDGLPGFINGRNINLSDPDTADSLCGSGNTTSSPECVTIDPNSTVSEACLPPYQLWHIIILGILAGSTCIITVLGNLVVILSFILERAIRQPTNYFIASLACSDLLIGLISMPFYTIYLLTGQYWPLGEVLCDLWLSTDYTVCLTSIYTVFCITIDRFCMVKLPAKYRSWRTERKVLFMIGFTWVVPVIVFFTSIFGWQYFVGVRTVAPDQCYVQYMEDALFNCILQIGYFWVTLCIMCVLYTGIYKVALDLHRKSAAKQKKMTSLVSMAGQTMTKIGIGMSQQHTALDLSNKLFKNQDTLKPKSNAANGKSANTNNNQQAKNLSTSFSSQGRTNDDERSSSPIYPSDTEPSSQSPNRQHSPRPRRLHKTKNRSSHNGKVKGNKSKGKANAAPQPPPPAPPQPKPLPPPPPPALVAECMDKKSGVYDNRLVNDPDDTGCEQVCDNELLTGLRYIDQESLKSLESNDTIRLLTKMNNPDTHLDPDPDSPVWKPRDALLSDPDAVEAPKSPIKLSPPPLRSSGRDGSDEVGRKLATMPDYGGVYIAAGPADPISFPPRSVVAPDTTGCCSTSKLDPACIQVDANEDNTTVSRIADPEKTVRRSTKHKHKSSPLRSLLKHHGSSGKKRRNQQGKGKKDSSKTQKSKSENRARKALRTITIILGAFVLCWTPWHILSMIIGFSSNPSCGVLMLYDISYWLCYLNSPINPFCYAMANQQFKKTFIRIIKLDWHRT